ncbi:MAG: glycosyltransferase family protein [Desulfomonilaceae bacterium]
MSRKTLVYIDPGFRLGRHYVNMAETISAECDSRGIRLLHYIGKAVPKNLVTRYGLINVFNNGCRPGPESSASFSRDAVTILDDAIKYADDGSKVVFYMYCGHMGHFKALCELLVLPKYESLNIKFYMNLSYQDLNCGRPVEEYAEELKYLSEFLESRDRKGRIIGIMDNQQSIDHYQPFFTREIRLMPIPLYDGRPKVNPVNSKRAPLTIGYFGQLIEEQGYSLATSVYEEFVENRSRNDVGFLMRVNRNNCNGALVGHFEDFRRKTDHLRIIDGFVEPQEHYDLISECDIVILPYLKEYYPYRTSGILLDALIHGKVVVVPQDTWMSEMIEEYGAGCAFESGDLASLVSAVDRVTEKYSAYAASASRNVTELHSQFSAASLLDLMF